MSEHYSLGAGSFQPRYDRACDKWEPRCPHGDECSGCDAVGHCAKGRAEAKVAATIEVTPNGTQVITVKGVQR